MMRKHMVALRKPRGPRIQVVSPRRYRVKPAPGGIAGLLTKAGTSQIVHYAVTSFVFWVVVAVVFG